MAAKRKAQNLNNDQISLYDYQLPEVEVRLVLNEKSALYSSTPLRTPQDAVDVMGDLLRGSDREMVCIISTDSKLRPISYNVVSIGGLSSAMVPIANCFKAALITANAASVILLHSHPSGDATPSQEDFDVTKRFVQAGKLLDIPALDHVVIGAYNGEQYSFRENHPEMFYAEPDLSIFPEIDPSKGWSVAEYAPEYETEKGEVTGGAPASTGAPERENLSKSNEVESNTEAYGGRIGKASVISRLSDKKSEIAERPAINTAVKDMKNHGYSLD